MTTSAGSIAQGKRQSVERLIAETIEGTPTGMQNKPKWEEIQPKIEVIDPRNSGTYYKTFMDAVRKSKKWAIVATPFAPKPASRPAFAQAEGGQSVTVTTSLVTIVEELRLARVKGDNAAMDRLLEKLAQSPGIAKDLAKEACIQLHLDKGGKKENVHTGVYGDFEHVHGDFSNIWGNVGKLRGDVSGLKGCVDDIEGEIHITGTINITGNISNISGCIDGINGDVSNINGDVTNVNGRVTKVVGTVTHLIGNIGGLVGDVSRLSGPANGVFGNVNVFGILEITGNIGGIHGCVDGLRGDVSNIRGDVTHIHGDASNIRGAVDGINGDVSNLSGDVSGITGNVDKLSGDVTRLVNDVSGLSGDASNVYGDATGVECNVTFLEGDISAIRGKFEISKRMRLVLIEESVVIEPTEPLVPLADAPVDSKGSLKLLQPSTWFRRDKAAKPNGSIEPSAAGHNGEEVLANVAERTETEGGEGSDGDRMDKVD